MSHDHSNSERKSIWETKERMPTVNEIPASAYRGSQAYPYNDYNQAMQSYRQSTVPRPFEPNNSTKTNHGICGPSKKHFIGALLIATIVGLTISGIPLGVMTTLYIQEKSARNCNTASTNSNSSSSSGSSGSSVTLPSQCSTYTTRSEADRNAAYTSCSGCYCDSSLSTGWYRFTGASGTRLATSPVSMYNCGTSYPGWFNGTLSSTAGTTTTGSVCVNYSGNLCYSPYSVNVVLATNCGDFFVYYLTTMSYCSTRYCTT